MFVIVQRHDGGARWLLSTEQQDWGDKDHALRFLTRDAARRAAAALKVSGDWSIEPGGNSSLSAELEVGGSRERRHSGE